MVIVGGTVRLDFAISAHRRVRPHARPVRRSQFADLRRQCIELRRPNSALEIQNLLILDAANTVSHGEASQPFRERQREIERGESAACSRDKMHALQSQYIEERQQVVGVEAQPYYQARSPIGPSRACHARWRDNRPPQTPASDTARP
jgi:hypothetical protein